MARFAFAAALLLCAACFTPGGGGECPEDACAVGETRCTIDGSAVQRCVGQDECGTWVDESCGTRAYCVGAGEPEAYCWCDDECRDEAAQICRRDLIQRCSADEVGCLYWEDVFDCETEGRVCNVYEGEPLCGRWVKPDGLAAISIRVDDRANRTYAEGQLTWIGNMRFQPDQNYMVIDVAWVGPYVPLWDDGPYVTGGHEAADQTANDHVFSAEPFLRADRSYQLQYAIEDELGHRIWPGEHGVLHILNGEHGRVAAPGLVIEPFGSVDVRVTFDTNARHPDFGFPFTSVGITTNLTYDERIELVDDGDGVYTFQWSEHLGPHDGLRHVGDVVRFLFWLDATPYRFGGVPYVEGVRAHTDHPGPGQWTEERFVGSGEALEMVIGPD